MKIKTNNRDEKINLVKMVMTNTPWCQETAIARTIEYIHQQKVSKSSKSGAGFTPIVRGSVKYYKSVVDTYERSLGAVLLYCFLNNIPTDIGYFYFIKSNSFPGYVKLGQTQDVETRLQQYQTASPFRDFYIDKYLICRQTAQVEKLAINLLRDKIHKGEWIETETPREDFQRVCKFLDKIGKPNRFSFKTRHFDFKLP